LKEGIGLRAYGQKDPLLEYKHEGFRTFTDMLARINEEILEIVFKAQIQVDRVPERFQPVETRVPAEMATVHEEAVGMGFSGTGQAQQPESQPLVGKRQPVRVDKKAGRNDPCPCGSGKKFKHCHGRMGS
jgi:preprotein translocase subunit SecA